MPTDRAVLAALEKTLEADPGNTAVRLHLASLYLTGGDPDRSLSHCRYLWEHDPTDVTAYELGAQAAEAAGLRELAAGLLEAAANPPGPAEAARPDGHPSSSSQPTTPPPLPPSEPPDAIFVEPSPTWPPVPVINPSVLGTPESVAGAQVSRPTLRLDDVAGMSEVKASLDRSLLTPLRNPELGSAFRKSLRGGMLLWGPPGCGKTYLARAVSGEIGSGFIHVKLSDVLDMWLGNSERNVAALFTRARETAPAVLFVDELDAMGHKRSRLEGTAMRQVVAQFLGELDGVSGDNDGVYMLGATNQPWDVDTALRRPGRYDRTLLVLPPDLEARVAIVAAALQDRPTEGCDAAVVAGRTETYSGADLTFVVSAAAELALEASAAARRVCPITQEHLDAALDGIGPSTHDWLRAASDVASFSDDTRMFAPLVEYLRRVGMR